MALRKIVLRGDDILRKKAKEVTNINQKIVGLLDDMWETMESKNGVGLAAPQVGILRRVAVVNGSEYDEEGNIVLPEKKYELINPVRLSREGEKIEKEACLSVPGCSGMVSRPERVRIKASDRYGNSYELEAEGFLARVICHEMDHLDGVLFTDIAESVETEG